MRKYLLIGIGGVLGAVMRYLIREVNIYGYYGDLPLNTLFINITGTFILSLVLTAAFEFKHFHEDTRLGITTGFLGAFTTFSTLCKESMGLINQGHYLTAMTYLFASAVLGLGAAYFGIYIIESVALRFTGKENVDREGELTENTEGEAE